MDLLPVDSATAPTPLTPPDTTPTARNATSYSGGGALSKQQLDTLRAVAGYDFNWPPTADSGLFPLAAARVAHHNLQTSFTAEQSLTVDNLKSLAASGLIDAAGLARGTAFLRGERAADVAPVARPVPGTVAADGSMYL